MSFQPTWRSRILYAVIIVIFKWREEKCREEKKGEEKSGEEKSGEKCSEVKWKAWMRLLCQRVENLPDSMQTSPPI